MNVLKYLPVIGQILRSLPQLEDTSHNTVTKVWCRKTRMVWKTL